MIALRARYVFPVDAPPLRDGVVVCDGGRILSVGGQSSQAARDLGNVAIVPGLVNPHTHLEFSDLRRPLGTPGMALPDWIRLVVRNRRERPGGVDSIRQGIAESTGYGVTAVGEIASTPWRMHAPLPLAVTEFIETIALRADRAERAFAGAAEAVSPKAGWTDSFRPGLSPHAPYSVRPELVRRLVHLSAERKLPLAHHLAESREELELLRSGSGPFVELLKEFDAWDPGAIAVASRPLDYLRMLAEAHRALVIHANYLDDDEVDFLAAHSERMSVIYCPRTHAFFQHDRYPLAKMLSAGVHVAIGTDSRASAPDLNPLAEMQFAAQQHRDVPPATFLQMITSSAAKALGRDADIGTITAGKSADLAIVQLPDQEVVDPHELLLDPQCRPTATIFRGEPVHGQERFTAGSW
jgi:aminodeoxyfutalosine deaminase